MVRRARLVRGADRELSPLMATVAGMRRSPIVTVNVWFDRPVLRTPFVGLPGRVMQWVFDTSADSAVRGDPVVGRSSSRAFAPHGSAHLSLVSSGAEAVAAPSNEELIALAVEELRESLPGARDARLLRATVVREPQATFSLALGQPARPGTRTAVSGAVAGRRLGRYGPAGHDRKRRRQRSPGRRCDILSGRAQNDASARGR